MRLLRAGGSPLTAPTISPSGGEVSLEVAKRHLQIAGHAANNFLPRRICCKVAGGINGTFLSYEIRNLRSGSYAGSV